MKTFNEMFAESDSMVLESDGKVIRPFYETADVPERFSVEFVHDKGVLRQGVCLKIRGASLRVNGHVSTEINLWIDTAPLVVEFDVIDVGRKSPALRVWNIWANSSETITHAFSGNAGVVVVGSLHDVGGVILNCAAYNEAQDLSFDDLIVRVVSLEDRVSSK